MHATTGLTGPAAIEGARICGTVDSMHPDVLRTLVKTCEAYETLLSTMGDDPAAITCREALFDRVALELDFTPADMPERSAVRVVRRAARNVLDHIEFDA